MKYGEVSHDAPRDEPGLPCDEGHAGGLLIRLVGASRLRIDRGSLIVWARLKARLGGARRLL